MRYDNGMKRAQEAYDRQTDDDPDELEIQNIFESIPNISWEEATKIFEKEQEEMEKLFSESHVEEEAIGKLCEQLDLTWEAAENLYWKRKADMEEKIVQDQCRDDPDPNEVVRIPDNFFGDKME